MISVEFLITSLIVVLIPGTGVIFTISTGLVQGRKASVYAALGCTTGIVPHLLATIFGLAAIMHTSALAFEVLKFAGVLYLFYLAVMTWKDKSGFEAQSLPTRSSALSLATKAFLLNILNPKLTIFFLAFLPQFVKPETTSSLGDMLVLSAVFMLMTFVVFVIYGLLAHGFRHSVMESRRVQMWLQKGFALTFAGLGVQLAVTQK